MINSFIKIICKIIYKILFFFNNFIQKFIGKNFLYYFKEQFELDNYIKIKIQKKDVKFFVPNKTAKWRVDTLFSKEPETLEWIDKFNKKKIFWDIGANIGLYSLYAANVHEDIEIISFEPSTSNLRILSRNISINNLSNKIKINQLPLSAHSNTNAIMHEPKFIEGWSMNSFGDSKDYEGKEFISEQKYSLYGTNIDFYIENKILKVPNYIKIDVDGIEHKILQGAQNCLSDKKLESISIELSENYQEQYQIVIKIMKEHNFKLKQKKHAEIFDNNNKISKLYNFIFERKT